MTTIETVLSLRLLRYSNMQDHYLQSIKYNTKYLQNTLKVTERCLRAFIRTDQHVNRLHIKMS